MYELWIMYGKKSIFYLVKISKLEKTFLDKFYVKDYMPIYLVSLAKFRHLNMILFHFWYKLAGEGGGLSLFIHFFLSSRGGSYFLNIINNSSGAHGDTSHRKNKQLSIRQR